MHRDAGIEEGGGVDAAQVFKAPHRHVPLTRTNRSTNWPPTAGEKGNQMSDIQFEQFTAAEASLKAQGFRPVGVADWIKLRFLARLVTTR